MPKPLGSSDKRPATLVPDSATDGANSFVFAMGGEQASRPAWVACGDKGIATCFGLRPSRASIRAALRISVSTPGTGPQIGGNLPGSYTLTKKLCVVK
jgi:hypothetical protein